MFNLVQKNYFTSRYQNSINIFTSNVVVKKSDGSDICKIGLTLEFVSYLCWGFILGSFLATYWAYNAPFYLVETDYKKWVSNLPSYTICAEVNSSAFIEKLQKIKKDLNTEFVSGLLNPTDKYCHKCSNISKGFPKNKYKKIVEKILQLCEGLLLSCVWNGKPFQCCRFFQKLPTDRGFCFSINSLQTKDPENFPHDMVATHSQPKTVFEIEASVPIRVYIHDRKELQFQFMYHAKPIFPGQQGKILYRFEDVIEDETSWLLTLNQRNCVLSNEINLEGFNIYSESACRLNCISNKQIKFCKCKHHLLQAPGNDCGIKGLQCLDKHKKKFENFDDCDCLQDCAYTEVKYIQYSIKKFSKQIAFATIELAKPPTERVILISQITKLDIIVTIACLSRLITNATFDEMVFQLYITTKEFFLLIKNYWKLFFSKLKPGLKITKKS